LRQEIEKRLGAKQQVFDMKDEMESLSEEIAVVKEKYLELKGQDLNPLIDAIRDLQVESSEQDLHLKETTCDLRFRPVDVVVV
jgi:archaellum component FlaC